MAKLNGGEFLLDLTPIEVEESVDTETYTSITNVDVLKQLTNLKRYIVNPSAIKPVWVKFVNSETDEIVVVKGELSKVIDSDEFDIHVKTKGYDLTIHVEFTQALNEDNDPIDDWYIDTNDAKYLFTSNVVSGGTQLYKHSIEFRDYNAVTIVSTRKTPFDLTDQDDIFEYTNSFRLFGGWVSTAEYDAGRITWLDYDTNKLLVKYYDTSEEQYISLEIPVGDDRDIVTPL